VIELVGPKPPVIEEQNATPAKNTTGPDKPLGLTEEEERELAELMGDEDNI
jgi:hypothetical protein